jgi:hypothetical protein
VEEVRADPPAPLEGTAVELASLSSLPGIGGHESTPDKTPLAISTIYLVQITRMESAIGQKQTSAFHFRAANSLYVLLSFQLACSTLACIGTNLFACPCADDGQILPQYRMRASPQYRRAAALPLFRRANSLLADYWSTSRKPSSIAVLIRLQSKTYQNQKFERPTDAIVV